VKYYRFFMDICKKRGLQALAAGLALLVGGCGSVQVTNVGGQPNRYMMEYHPGAVEARAPVLNAMERKAAEYCPDGWTNLSKGRNAAEHYYQMYWVIECKE